MLACEIAEVLDGRVGCQKMFEPREARRELSVLLGRSDAVSEQPSARRADRGDDRRTDCGNGDLLDRDLHMIGDSRLLRVPLENRIPSEELGNRLTGVARSLKRLSQ